MDLFNFLEVSLENFKCDQDIQPIFNAALFV